MPTPAAIASHRTAPPPPRAAPTAAVCKVATAAGEAGVAQLDRAKETHSAPAHNWGRITRAISTGDADAFGIVYERFFDHMYQAVQRSTGFDEATCLDAVHDGMLRAIRQMRPIADERALAAWLRRAALSAALDQAKRETRRRRRERRAARHELSDADSSNGAAAVAEAEPARLREELALLDEQLTTMLHARYRLGFTLERAGRLVGLSASAADGRLRRALAQLRENMQEQADER